MVDAIPFTEITSQSNYIRDIMLLLMFVLGVVAYIISYFISTSSIKRISLLARTMQKVESGELQISISSKSSDEIGKLYESFNYMVKRIRILIDEQFKSGRELKNMELKALQAQINPHFLYNTLDLINWKAIDNHIPEIAEIAQSLAKFYKLSLNKGKDIVSIKDEINHVKTYIQIQNLRFDNRINFVLDFDPEILNYSILKIVLQPIVENSILHGILENKKAETGTISISGHIDRDMLCIEVIDDGIGISEEKLAEVFSDNPKSDVGGYGIKNIHNRIKLHYGDQYGLSYKSAVGFGTTVNIRIPAIKYEMEN
jgi:two-component system sensor histidine kinase YesM